MWAVALLKELGEAEVEVEDEDEFVPVLNPRENDALSTRGRIWLLGHASKLSW